MKRWGLSVIAILLLILQVGFLPTDAAPPPPPDSPESTASPLETAIQQEISNQREIVLAYLLFDTKVENLRYAEDGTWTIADLISVDPETQFVVQGEPGLAIVRSTPDGQEIYLPNEPGWTDALTTLPDALVSAQDKATWLEMYQTTTATDVVYSGYKLPWEDGKGLVLTRSITHYDPPNPTGSMHYSFDFAAWHDSTGTSPMFAVHASKGGRVKWARWWQANGSETSPGNYLVIEDLSTSPATYALYLHLAQDSIPTGLRTVGAHVDQGQYIGLADDTGLSTGNHLHFQVHTNPSSYWGSSVDITFSDVSINGGRPRTPREASNWPQYGAQGQVEYFSGNSASGDDTPPTGDLDNPADRSIFYTPELQISGWAEDDTALDSIQVKAFYSGAWHPVGAELSSSPFDFSWDTCDDDVPSGPITLALEIRDAQGNSAEGTPGMRRLVWQYECPQRTAVCRPGTNQVAIYSEPDFQGDCIQLGTGTHSSSVFGQVKDNDVESIQVGSGVWGTLFNGSQQGRGTTVWASDSNLSDNRIGSNFVSSLVVRSRTTAPTIPQLVYPANQAIFPANASLSLAWDDMGGALEFQVKWAGVDQPWQSQPVLHLGSLAPGSYSWQVRARNSGGTSSWSSIRTLTISDPVLLPEAPTYIAPFFDNIENGYNGWSRGEWDQTTEQNHTPGGSISFNYEINDRIQDYNTGGPNSGYLTSPPITIPSTGYALQFWYRYQTEGPGLHWDQRWVQISVDGGPYTNLLQLFDDPPDVWLLSPSIDLSRYAGKNIRIRFLFETIDGVLNGFAGWYIDDVAIDLAPQVDCDLSSEPDESSGMATQLGAFLDAGGQLCPQGDEDFFRFSGTAGDVLGISSIAGIPHQPDSYLYLMDNDFSSILAENDDMVTGDITDAYFTYRIKRDGIYYLKLKAWNHPSAGGSDYNYHISLYGNDKTAPTGHFSSPQSLSCLAYGNASIQVAAEDNPSAGESAAGVSHVEFLWHSSNWSGGDWMTLGSDWDSSDGWSYNFDTSLLTDERFVSLFARIYDWAGNRSGIALWDVCLGETPNHLFFPVLVR